MHLGLLPCAHVGQYIKDGEDEDPWEKVHLCPKDVLKATGNVKRNWKGKKAVFPLILWCKCAFSWHSQLLIQGGKLIYPSKFFIANDYTCELECSGHITDFSMINTAFLRAAIKWHVAMSFREEGEFRKALHNFLKLKTILVNRDCPPQFHFLIHRTQLTVPLI